VSGEALTPEQVAAAKREQLRAKLDLVMHDVNSWLVAADNARYDIAKIVPSRYRAAIAERLTAAGWQVSYSPLRDDYADYFTVEPAAKPPSQGPYR
jgi:hypothetical protein